MRCVSVADAKAHLSELLDTSVLVPLFFNETGTVAARHHGVACRNSE